MRRIQPPASGGAGSRWTTGRGVVVSVGMRLPRLSPDARVRFGRRLAVLTSAGNDLASRSRRKGGHEHRAQPVPGRTDPRGGLPRLRLRRRDHRWWPARAGRRADGTGPDPRRGRRGHSPLRQRSAGRGPAVGRGRGAGDAELPRVRGGLPRHAAGRRDGGHREPALHGRGAALPVRALRRPRPW